MNKTKLIPAPIDEKHVSLDFLDNVFESTETEGGNVSKGVFRGETYEVKYKCTGNLLLFKPKNGLSSNWMELHSFLEEMFSEDYGDGIVVVVDMNECSGSVFLWFYTRG